MKKIIVMAAIGVLASNAVALAGDPNIGCGWGTQSFKGQSGVATKVLAVTTNHILGSQTFGISTGTAGCSQKGAIQADARVTSYAAANLDQLLGEIAAGEGESLDTLAHLIGVSETDAPAFRALTKQNFATLFSSDETTAGAMLAALEGLMANDAQFAQYVS